MADEIDEELAKVLELSRRIEADELEFYRQMKINENQQNEQLLSEFIKYDEEILNDKINILENILPDADPNVFRTFLMNNPNPNAVEEFVNLQLNSHNYSKRTDYYTTMDIAQYTTAFIVQDFLQKFPDPINHFENPKRKCVFNETALQYLKKKYPSGDMNNCVTNIYNFNRYNLSLADKSLQQMYAQYTFPDVSHIKDIILLQEIAFITHKKSIEDYIKLNEQKQLNEIESLREKNLLLVCECCYNEMIPKSCIKCEDGHMFCRNCAIKGTDLAVSEGQTSVLCFSFNCNKEFHSDILTPILPMKTLKIYLKKRQEKDILDAKLENLVTCPFCSYMIDLDPQIQIFTCKNPQCMRITCRSCKKLNHLPIRCKDVIDNDKARCIIEEEMSKAFIRHCNKCAKPFIKSDGCNKMTCPCGAIMCYICKNSIVGYEHFDSIGGCKLHQNSIIHDQEAVQISRVTAISRLKKDFPDIDLPDQIG